MPRVLLTGASGFVGQAVLARLCKSNWSIVVLKHKRPVSMKALGHPHETYDADIQDDKALGQLEVLVDTICHTAAFIPPDYSDSTMAAHCFGVNALGTLNLLRWAVEHKARRFINISTAAVYAPCSGGLVSEAHPTYPAHRATYYAASKLAGELFAEHFQRVHDLETVSLRLASVYGPGMRSRDVVARFMHQAEHGTSLTVFGGGREAADFVYVDDVAWAVEQALQTDAVGVYNIGSGVATTILELAQCIAMIYSDRQVQVNVLPPSEGPASSPCALDIGRARAAWGYAPRILEEGLRSYKACLEHAIEHSAEDQ